MQTLLGVEFLEQLLNVLIDHLFEFDFETGCSCYLMNVKGEHCLQGSGTYTDFFPSFDSLG